LDELDVRKEICTHSDSLVEAIVLSIADVEKTQDDSMEPLVEDF
jgi:hypothetical protein